MRQHLYKAKAFNGEWIFGGITSSNHSIDEDTRIISFSWEENNEENVFFTVEKVIPETVCQYIGIEDTNGELVFEGDIIMHKEYKVKYIITYDYSSFKAKSIEDGRLLDLQAYGFAENSEVIGNLFD